MKKKKRRRDGEAKHRHGPQTLMLWREPFKIMNGCMCRAWRPRKELDVEEFLVREHHARQVQGLHTSKSSNTSSDSRSSSNNAGAAEAVTQNREKKKTSTTRDKQDHGEEKRREEERRGREQEKEEVKMRE